MAKRIYWAILAAVGTYAVVSVILLFIRAFVQVTMWVEYNTAVPGYAVAMSPLVIYIAVLAAIAAGSED